MPRVAKPWFRIYSATLDNPKVQRLPIDLRWHWLELMCLANITEPRGSLPCLADISFRLRISDNEAQQIIDALTTANLLEETGGRMVLHDWAGWQFDSDTRDTPGRSAADETHSQSTDRRRSAAESPPNRRRSAAQRRGEEKREREDTEAEGEPEPDNDPSGGRGGLPPIWRVGEQVWNRMITPHEGQRFDEMIGDYGREAVEFAIRTAADANRRDVRYVEGICRRHKEETTNGHRNGASSSNEEPGAHPDGVVGGVPGLDRRSAFVAQQRQRRDQQTG